MGTEIKAWQIQNGKLNPVSTTLQKSGRTEPYDLEPWIASNPAIIGEDILIIGRQVKSKSGQIDLLGIDRTGNTVIIELKRDLLPREVLAQAVDYASDVASWTIDRISEICTSYTQKSLEELFSDSFSDVDLEGLNINATQRIILVGFSIEASLERMIEWLSDVYSVNINAVVLNYLQTANGDELLTRTSIISEEIEQERVKKAKKFEIPMSDEPGKHEKDKLAILLRDYLSKSQITIQRIRDIFLPACLKHETLTRNQLKQEFLAHDPDTDPSKVGYYLTIISSQLGMKKNDFLRQIVTYSYPNYRWEKDNFKLNNEYRGMIEKILREINEEKKKESVRNKN